MISVWMCGASAPGLRFAPSGLRLLSGQLHVGMGDTLDKAKAEALGPGGFFAMARRMHHSVFASGETIIQVTSMGPFDITYLDPKDDPRQNTTGAR
jgi:hypothetical protein